MAHKVMSAPVSASGLFGTGSDSDADEFDNSASESVITVGGEAMRIRERPFHPLNANAVWPGDFMFYYILYILFN